MIAGRNAFKQRALRALLLLTGATLVGFSAATAEDAPAKTLKVATKVSAPFAMKNEEGSWTGITIDLWRFVANELDLAYEFEEATVPEMIEGLTTGRFDAAAAALTVTHEREERVDFTHSYHSSGLAIGVPFETKESWISVLLRVASVDFVKALGVLVLVVLAAGFLVWVFERKKNPEQFGGRGAKGVASGFWWSAVTMTTVGYGDKAPKTFWGRIVALVWMFASIILISILMATIASVLTVSQLESGMDGPEDLPGLKVGTVRGTTSESYLNTVGGVFLWRYDTPREAADAVVAGEIQAVVYDAPLLRYLANNEMKGKMRVVLRQFERQEYAIGLPDGSPLRERINRVLLKKISGQSWQEILSRYLGNR